MKIKIGICSTSLCYLFVCLKLIIVGTSVERTYVLATFASRGPNLSESKNHFTRFERGSYTWYTSIFSTNGKAREHTFQRSVSETETVQTTHSQLETKLPDTHNQLETEVQSTQVTWKQNYKAFSHLET